MEPCCAHKFSLLRQTIADELKHEEELLAIAEEDQELVLFGTSRWEHVKKWLFLLLERPDSSIFSKARCCFNTCTILWKWCLFLNRIISILSHMSNDVLVCKIYLNSEFSELTEAK